MKKLNNHAQDSIILKLKYFFIFMYLYTSSISRVSASYMMLKSEQKPNVYASVILQYKYYRMGGLKTYNPFEIKFLRKRLYKKIKCMGSGRF